MELALVGEGIGGHLALALWHAIIELALVLLILLLIIVDALAYNLEVLKLTLVHITVS